MRNDSRLELRTGLNLADFIFGESKENVGPEDEELSYLVG